MGGNSDYARVSTPVLKIPKKHIPVGGRLSHFFKEWSGITQDAWVLEVVERGYALEFAAEPPPYTGVRQTQMSDPAKMEVVLQEIHTLLEKGAIEEVPRGEEQEGFYSTLFLVPKKDPTKMRPVINLKPLNRFLVKKPFKVDHLMKVCGLLRKGDWAISIDLTDAYFHVKIRPSHKKYLRFAANGKCYQFTCLPFGPTVAPRVWTKILSAAVEHVRKLGVQITSFFDDSLLFHRAPKSLIESRDLTLLEFNRVGLLVNLGKSDLEPNQSQVYIGGHFQLDVGLVALPWERFLKLQEILKELTTKRQAPALLFLKVLGKMAAMIYVVRLARLHMRPIQLHLLLNWKPSSRDYQKQIPISDHLRDHLKWWQEADNLSQGCPLSPPAPDVTVTTDASGEKWGAECMGEWAQEDWTLEESSLHSNILEMEGVIRALLRFRSHLQNKHILIRTDNMSVCQYLNKQGGTKSPSLCIRTWKAYQVLEELGSTAEASHISGVLNTHADFLSRQVQESEWGLNPKIVKLIFQRWGSPIIDLFASERNYQLQTFCCWKPSPSALQRDAFTLNWDHLQAYAFPPVFLIPKLIQKLDRSINCSIILIAPRWARRPWFNLILDRLIEVPLLLPVRSDLLKQPVGQYYHPNPGLYKLTAWHLSSNEAQIMSFQNRLRHYAKPQSDQALGRTMTQSSPDTTIGVLNGVSIPVHYL